MKKMEWQSEDVFVIKNDTLDCKDCIYKGTSTATCIPYSDGKPHDVLIGGKCKKKNMVMQHEPI